MGIRADTAWTVDPCAWIADRHHAERRDGGHGGMGAAKWHGR